MLYSKLASVYGIVATATDVLAADPFASNLDNLKVKGKVIVKAVDDDN